MNFPFYIARRYLFAKKSQTAVNVLTLVAVIGVSFGTMALVVVLSVFNGFENLILSLFNSFNPDMEIRLAEGKSFDMDEFPAEELKNIPGVLHLGEVYEETALLMYRERQHIVKLRGVDENYRYITGLDTMLLEGEYKLRSGDHSNLIIGQGVAYVLGANINDLLNPLTIYIPKRGRISGIHPAQAFNASTNYAAGVFGVQAEFDMEYVIAPISLLRFLTEHNNQVTSVMLAVDPSYNLRQVQQEVSAIMGEDFIVRNRLQQEEFLYKVMRSEKWAIFFILTFIVLIAAFNITGSLTMLVLEKTRDIGILRSMGASLNMVKKVFLYEGILISAGGALAGIILGAVISWLQTEFGLVKIQAEGTFIIDTYPIQTNPIDFILVFFTVAFIGFMASWLPTQKIPSFSPEDKNM
ncbi:MAG: FtsX-like permease family protein [Bacteroidales bacterium]